MMEFPLMESQKLLLSLVIEKHNHYLADIAGQLRKELGIPEDMKIEVDIAKGIIYEKPDV